MARVSDSKVSDLKSNISKDSKKSITKKSSVVSMGNLEIASDLSRDLSNVGFIVEGDLSLSRTGSYMLKDNNNVVSNSSNPDVELLDTKTAMKKYPFVKDYMWSLVKKDKDEYTRMVADEFDGGYFIRVKENAKVDLPLQSCLMICKKSFVQKVHNVIILEKNSELKIITGCMQHSEGEGVSHIGISEIFLKSGAKLNFTMIHNWNEDTFVRPRTAVKLDKDAEFVSNYVLLNPVKDIQMYPVAYCDDRSKASFNGIVYANSNSLIDSGARIELNGKDSKGEIISRVVTNGKAKVYSRGMLVGRNASKGHMECNGIMLSKTSSIIAVPEIIAENNDSELSHEAAVGKIADKEIFYLMTRGLCENEAVSAIIRGFMDVGIFGLPENLSKNIQKVVDDASKGF